MEFIWSGSDSLQDGSYDVFTGVFSSGNYGPPEFLCFDELCQDPESIVDDENMREYNLDYILKEFVESIHNELSVTKGDNIAYKMGSDFTYSNANMWYVYQYN